MEKKREFCLRVCSSFTVQFGFSRLSSEATEFLTSSARLSVCPSVRPWIRLTCLSLPPPSSCFSLPFQDSASWSCTSLLQACGVGGTRACPARSSRLPPPCSLSLPEDLHRSSRVPSRVRSCRAFRSEPARSSQAPQEEDELLERATLPPVCGRPGNLPLLSAAGAPSMQHLSLGS